MANIIRFQISMLSVAVFAMMGAQASGPVSLGGIGSPCDGVSKLCIANAKCYDKVCECADGFIPDRSQRVCIEETREWQGPCTDDLQCHKFEGAICSKGICDCQPNYHFLGGKCWTTRHLNEECTDDNECYLNPHADRIECSSGICGCRDGYHITDTGDDCSGASELWKVGITTLLAIQVIKSLLI
ncbi:hypothetical protein J437_LFUL004151 [Ladona fulva]|uniref:EB domain-containing protein n=1 Tax=Ladona fulva TaxID=123851 RepID=A0A8K0K0E6_LADFU|nr:hypothetical protein J437_LFUL004151 [Ladona fulva]